MPDVNPNFSATNWTWVTPGSSEVCTHTPTCHICLVLITPCLKSLKVCRCRKIQVQLHFLIGDVVLSTGNTLGSRDKPSGIVEWLIQYFFQAKLVWCNLLKATNNHISCSVRNQKTLIKILQKTQLLIYLDENRKGYPHSTVWLKTVNCRWYIVNDGSYFARKDIIHNVDGSHSIFSTVNFKNQNVLVCMSRIFPRNPIGFILLQKSEMKCVHAVPNYVVPSVNVQFNSEIWRCSLILELNMNDVIQVFGICFIFTWPWHWGMRQYCFSVML